MKHLKRLVVIVLASAVIYHAVIGVACMYGTAPLIEADNTCDKIQRIEGKNWCMNFEPETLNPQETRAFSASEPVNPQQTISNSNKSLTE